MKEPRSTTLYDLFKSEDVFCIPCYQRNYVWKEENVKRFLNKLEAAGTSEPSRFSTENFIGNIYIQQTKNNHVYDIVDGQQRLTTIMLFMCAYRDLTGNTSYNDCIKPGINREHPYKLELLPNYTNTGNDNSRILRDIINNEPLDLKKLKNNNIYKAYKTCKSYIEEYSKNHDDDREGFLDRCIKNAKAVKIVLEEFDDPYKCFEEINSTGKILTIAELTKNYLIGHQTDKSDTDEMNRKWSDIENKVGDMSDFLICYMTIKEKKQVKDSRSKNTFDNFNKFISIVERGGYSSSEVLYQLKITADSYMDVIHPEKVPDSKTKQERKIRNFLKDISLLKIKAINPFLTSVLMTWKSENYDFPDVKLSNENAADILDATRTYLYRRKIAGVSNNSQSKAFPKLLTHISDIDKASSKKMKMFEIFAVSFDNDYMRMPKDDAVIRGLREKEWGSKNLKNVGTRLLIIVEEHMNDEKYRPGGKDDLYLQHEHIAPQTSTAEWLSWFNNDEHTYNKYVNKLGNQSIIRHNQEAGNRSFAEKKEIYKKYKKSEPNVSTQMVIDKDHWSPEEINARTEFLIEEIMDVFAVPQL